MKSKLILLITLVWVLTVSGAAWHYMYTTIVTPEPISISEVASKLDTVSLTQTQVIRKLQALDLQDLWHTQTLVKVDSEALETTKQEIEKQLATAPQPGPPPTPIPDANK